jgi:hypothetical protein
VEDLFGRFLPFRFAVDLPHRKLYRLACGSPPTNVPLPPDSESDGVPLFTGPARPVTPNTVVIRAELWDAVNHRPARWAMLQARTPGQRLRGEAPRRTLADHRGRVALHFPIPDERDFDGGSFDSPSSATDTALGQRTWKVELDAAYGNIAPAPGTEQRPFPPIPDLCTALAQPAAKLWDRLGGSPTPLAAITVRFGQEAFIRSADAGTEPASVLLLTP